MYSKFGNKPAHDAFEVPKGFSQFHVGVFSSKVSFCEAALHMRRISTSFAPQKIFLRAVLCLSFLRSSISSCNPENFISTAMLESSLPAAPL